MNLHGRVDVFVGRFRRPSQARRFWDAIPSSFDDPDAQATRWFCASREVLERELNLRSWNSLFASKGDLRRFNQGSILLHISCFFRMTREKLFTEFAFCALQLEGFKGGRRFSDQPRISLWAGICGEVLLF
jgi:hypothetical protein